jgi:hypothetical protein
MCMNTTETRSYCTYCFRNGPARHVQARSVSGSALGCVWTRLRPVRTVRTASVAVRRCTLRRSGPDKCSLREFITEPDRDASCRKRLKYDDMNAYVNAELMNICRAGNATCMKWGTQYDKNGPYSVKCSRRWLMLTDRQQGHVCLFKMRAADQRELITWKVMQEYDKEYVIWQRC